MTLSCSVHKKLSQVELGAEIGCSALVQSSGAVEAQKNQRQRQRRPQRGSATRGERGEEGWNAIKHSARNEADDGERSTDDTAARATLGRASDEENAEADIAGTNEWNGAPTTASDDVQSHLLSS